MGFWIILIFISLASAVKKECPGGTFTCPDRASCCQLPDKSYGCCPMENAVCCDDGLHCCHEGTTCNLEERKCDGDGYVTHMYDSLIKSFDSTIPNITLSPLRSNKESSVICPGGQFQCPDGNTCCNLPNQRYSCCPLVGATCCEGGLYCCPAGNTCCKIPNQGYSCCPIVRAACCRDGLHCCPEHMHCDATSRYCNQGLRNITSLRHIPAKKTTNVTSLQQIPAKKIQQQSSVICPGGQFQCPDGNTCCNLPNQRYSCCPLVGATCCEGGLYCCPAGNTCCKIPNQGYSCCPLVRAACCRDGLHCCPEHMHCDATSRYCNQGLGNITSLRHIPAKKTTNVTSLQQIPAKKIQQQSSVICPGGQFQCPDGNTCCKNPHTQRFGCCPMENAVICDDGLHCCPEGTTCNLEEAKCDGDGYVTHMYDSRTKSFDSIISNITLSPLRSNKESSVICPGGQFQCPDGNTCCNLPNQRYSCCPLVGATCCEGGLYCCPAGNTCCKIPNQGYSCCPIVRAACCRDGLHCCPEHMHCDATSRYCNQGLRNITSLRHIPAKKTTNVTSLQQIPAKKIQQQSSVICPGGQFQCPDGNTCCKNPHTQRFGCCPMENAVICDDGLHCCPEGTTCNLEEAKCDGDGYVTHMYDSRTKSFDSIISNITLSPLRSNKESSVICPGGQFQCPDGNTCCNLPNQRYSCCPLVGATCCEGGLYCCPAGNTCCKIPNQGYSCCPIVRAACCRDGLHCCPEHMHCDATSRYCNQGLRNITSLRHIPAKKTTNVTSLQQIPAKKIQQQSSVICPGGQFQCPDGNTCCKLSNQGYSCCPLAGATCCKDGWQCCPRGNTCCKNPLTQRFGCCHMENAVCCDDGLHCCPEGTRCNLEETKCFGDGYVTHMYDCHIKSFDSIISNITLSSLRSDKESSVICPGGQYQCPNGNTCCKLPNQGYSCCPLVRATCCNDGLHCCPEHMHCDATSRYCNQGPRNVTSLRHIPAKKIQQHELSVICPGGQYQCPDGNTCCKLPNQGYSCCPLVRAACCRDGLHCCPEHFHCDATSRYCNQGPRNVTSIRHIPAKKIQQHELSVICPGGQYQCPDGNTCCKLPNQGYSCCPLVRATCCNDGLHCCPEHMHCDSTSRYCNQGPRNVTSQQKRSHQ